MSRQYQKKQHFLKQINEMLESGMTQREVEEELGLTGYRPVHELLKRERNKKVPGIPKPKGRLRHGRWSSGEQPAASKETDQQRF